MAAAIAPRSAPLVLVPQFFGSTVFERQAARYYPFDAQCTELLRQSVERPFLTCLDELDPEWRDAARAFYDDFAALDFFDADGCFTGYVLERAPAPDHLTGPLAVHLEVSAACNIRCRHCFAGELPRREEALTLPELETLFSNMAAMGSYRLGLTGGEPLLRRDLLEIIDLALDYGLHPCITSNGLLISETLARELARLEGFWLNISLEGATPASNDSIRGEGHYERLLPKLRLLADQGVAFSLAFTVTRLNWQESAACAQLAADLGADGAVFRPLYPVGRALDEIETLMPDYEQYAAALAALDRLPDSDLYRVDPFSPAARQEQRAGLLGNQGCGAANTVCSISLSGMVNPCSFLGPEFAAGSLREHELETIWARSEGFRAMRSLPGGPDQFSGGCRARALALAGSINAPDPWLRLPLLESTGDCL